MTNSKPKTSLQIVDQAVEDGQDNGYRSHLGASIIGAPCSRKILFGFRWFSKKKHPARKLRIFEAGNRIEEEVIADLKLVFEVWDKKPDGTQYSFSEFNGHYKGSGDGVVKGLVEDPRPVGLEIKSANHSSYKKLTSKELEDEYPTYYAQVIANMDGQKLPATFYVIQDKNNSERFQMFIEADPGIAAELKRKAYDIITATHLPDRISERPGWFECRELCDFRDICHMGKAVDRNCRTCRHSVANVKEGEPAWWCNHKNKELTKEEQLKACEKWVEFPKVRV